MIDQCKVLWYQPACAQIWFLLRCLAQTSNNKTPLWLKSARMFHPIILLQVSPLLPWWAPKYPQNSEVPRQNPFQDPTQRLYEGWAFLTSVRRICTDNSLSDLKSYRSNHLALQGMLHNGGTDPGACEYPYSRKGKSSFLLQEFGSKTLVVRGDKPNYN